jgi:arylsulfatase A-like enzyme/Flp pilus assembly protein TadD
MARGAAFSRVLGAAFAAAALIQSGCARPPQAASAANFNVLLITLDTVRADRLGAYGYTGVETPNLDRLASEGVRFAAAGSPVPLTLPAHATILSGLLPPRHGVRNNGAERFPQEPATLATRLAAAGYRTGAFIGAFVLDRRFGLGRGFDRYDDEIPRERAADLDAERPGRVVTDRALAWLSEKSEKPFFAWVHLYDAHAPYAPPEPFRTLYADRPYDGEIAEVDAQVGRLLTELERLGVAGRTVVAVVGDHGEALGEHGELTHGLLLYEPSLHVPLLLRAPPVLPKGWVVETPVSLVDLAPTLAGLLDCPLSAKADRPLDGHDLSQQLRERREPGAEDLYAESLYGTTFGWSPVFALRRGDMKYIAAPRPELYDLRRDPGEGQNVEEGRPDERKKLATRLAALAASGGKAAEPAEVDAEARARLLSLGYLAGASLATGGAPKGKDPKDAVILFRGFEEAHWALVDGRLADARGRFEKLVGADPTNAVFVGQLAEVCRRTGDLGQAIELYRRAVAIAPGDRDARYNLAVTLQDAGRHDEANEALTAAIAVDPGRPEAHNALGIALALRGELEGARRELTRSVELDPHNARAFNNLGNVLRDMKLPDEAEKAYRQAAELAPTYADPLNGLGTLEVQRDNPAAAIPYFDRALSIAPQLHEARLNRGIAQELAGHRDAAIAAYRDFLARTASDRQFAEQRQVARELLARLERGESTRGAS